MKQTLSLSAKDCKIDKVALNILEVMIQKVDSLIQTPVFVIPKPESSDGSYVVAKKCSWIVCLILSKGGSFKCNCTCIDDITKIVEHVLAVTENYGKLLYFVPWFKRLKSKLSVFCYALNGAGELVGKKPSNKQKAKINSSVDLLVDNDRSTPNFNV